VKASKPISTVNKSDRIYVAGHRGLVGAALVRQLRAQGYENLILQTHASFDLLRQDAVESLFSSAKPDYVFLAAARVGGIQANNTYPAVFLRDNLAIQTNVIDAAYRHKVKKLMFLGSSCIYPKHAPQPIREDSLLTGPLEPTNEWYAIAKIAGMKMCQAYRRQYGFDAISVMPTNLYGPEDNFGLQDSHVLPALLRKFWDARATSQSEVTIWGTGAPRREFLYVDDLAEACLYLMRTYSDEAFVNIGTGSDVTILELAGIIQRAVGYTGALRFDESKPDGTPRKLLDVSRLSALGWTAKTGLAQGIDLTVDWYRNNLQRSRQ
jgi:GDP-L-fucose synthase